MRILVISQFFPPEMGAPAARFFDFARHWIAAGHEVSVITVFPNFPNGVIPPQYRGKLYQRETMAAINVRRGYIYASRRLNFVTKALGYISSLVSSVLIITLAGLKYDVVISTSPPPTVGLPGLLASRWRGVPLVFDVRDIWPEALVQSGRLKNRLLIRFLEWVEMTVYWRAALISVVTQGKRARLVQRGVPGEKVVVIPNGVDLDLFDTASSQPLPGDLDALAARSSCLTYAGVFNPSQGIDVVIDAAARLREKCSELYKRTSFVLIGDGTLRRHLEARKAKLRLDRVHFVGIRPREQVFAMLRRSFAILVTLRRRGDVHTVPSKIYEALASGRPILLSAAGEPADIVRRSGAGTICEPGDAEGLTKAIQNYMLNPALAVAHGQAAREHCAKLFGRCQIAARFLKHLAHAVGSELSECRCS